MTKVTLPPIEFNYSFKSKKKAKQAAISAFMNAFNDSQILKHIKVESVRKPCGRCPTNKCSNCPVKEKK